MNQVKILGKGCSNIPWQEKSKNCDDILWRHDGNPIMWWNKTPKAARIFNSAVIPYEDGFIGIFRADHRDGIPQLHVGKSQDGINWEIEDEEIHWVDEKGNAYETNYAYDPRLVEIESKYYIVWCTDFGGPTIGLGVTEDFKTFYQIRKCLYSI